MSAPTMQVVPLVPGERLSREEFERRYDSMPDLKKAELIEGVVYMPSPTRFEQHGGPHADMITWLGNYRMFTPGVLVGDNATVRLDMENEPQPDAVAFIHPGCGGQARIDEDGYIAGAPEMAVEIAGGSASIDLNAKLRVYQTNGVREYLVWRVADRVIDWFALRGGRFVPLESDADGVIRSEVFPGLRLDVAAMIAGDLVRVHDVLRLGTADPAHAGFVARLQSAKPATPA